MDYPNWFGSNGAEQNFTFFLEGAKGAPISALQIGAFMGHATEWLIENVLTHPNATLTDVDTWGGSDEDAHEDLDWNYIEVYYDSETDDYQEAGRLIKCKMTSEEFFDKNDKTFDFIYVDGAHTALDVFNDGISAFECLNEGGILAFDDYTWDSGKGDFFNPRDGIDGVYITYQNQLNILYAGTQVWFQKVSRPKMLIEGV